VSAGHEGTELQNRVVKLKKVPFKVRFFKLVAPNGDIDWVITNDLAETVTAQVAKDTSAVRWQVEELHRDRLVPGHDSLRGQAVERGSSTRPGQ